MMLRQLFQDQREHISHFFDAVDQEQVERVFRFFFECTGAIFFTGVGKSGIIAEKVATTMASTGTRAQYIPPINALHGDLGLVGSDDLVVLISKSGESEELLDLMPSIRNKGATTICWVSKRKSRLESLCDHSVYLPVQRELCPFDLAPTTSAAVQLIFGDVLAVALMQAKQFTLDQYALNHPAGRIGKRISLRVRDLMLSGDALPLATPDAKLMDQLVHLSDRRCGCLLIAQNDHLLGIFTDGDLRRALQSNGADALQQPLSALMTPSPRSVPSDLLAWEAMRQMEEGSPVTVLPVVDSDRLVGLIRMHDILQSGL